MGNNPSGISEQAQSADSKVMELRRDARATRMRKTDPSRGGMTVWEDVDQPVRLTSISFVSPYCTE